MPEYTEGSGNVFQDLELPQAEERYERTEVLLALQDWVDELSRSINLEEATFGHYLKLLTSQRRSLPLLALETRLTRLRGLIEKTYWKEMEARLAVRERRKQQP